MPNESPSFAKTACWFLAGGAVTSLFSGSLYKLAENISFSEVIVVGMVVPCFTWFVQIGTSGLLMQRQQRDVYWSDLGWVCFWGSVALVPAGILNLLATSPPWSLSAANVLASVAVMSILLFRLCARQAIPIVWPVSFCATISLNMAIFLWSSRHWW